MASLKSNLLIVFSSFFSFKSWNSACSFDQASILFTNIGNWISIYSPQDSGRPWLQSHHPVSTPTEAKLFPVPLSIILYLNHSPFIRLLALRYPYHPLPVTNSSRFCVWASVNILTRSLSFPSWCSICSKAFWTFSQNNIICSHD